MLVDTETNGEEDMWEATDTYGNCVLVPGSEGAAEVVVRRYIGVSKFSMGAIDSCVPANGQDV